MAAAGGVAAAIFHQTYPVGSRAFSDAFNGGVVTQAADAFARFLDNATTSSVGPVIWITAAILVGVWLWPRTR